ncbi:hypothetical protein K469DRAFT_260190 [Zopfia rhizophila CBS 207.26]|uniref:Uncharacterized protein n=1 Tax=Zopfia rhizophila CBS 207.26 TaxID=1314779 RepID=A0A6A6DTQ3_9PEZI|nr:hypothetical protein K469DRAFT_260190 [Zopfia rhizophila CBS 207.26]
MLLALTSTSSFSSLTSSFFFLQHRIFRDFSLLLTRKHWLTFSSSLGALPHWLTSSSLNLFLTRTLILLMILYILFVLVNCFS